MFISFCLIVKYPWFLNQLSLNCGIVPGSGQTNDDVTLGRGPEGSTMHPPPPTSLQNYVFLNPQSVHNKKWDVNSKNIGTHYWFTALF